MPLQITPVCKVFGFIVERKPRRLIGFPNRRLVILIGALVLLFVLGLTTQITSASLFVPEQQGCPGACADSYYDSPDGQPQFAGARASMESAYPQVRDGGVSGMRVAVSHAPLSVPDDYGFAELGWEINPGRHGGSLERFVFSTACYTHGDCIDGLYQSMAQLAPDDISAHIYVVRKKSGTTWQFKFDGAELGFRRILDFSKGTTVVCGGEASST